MDENFRRKIEKIKQYKSLWVTRMSSKFMVALFLLFAMVILLRFLHLPLASGILSLFVSVGFIIFLILFIVILPLIRLRMGILFQWMPTPEEQWTEELRSYSLCELRIFLAQKLEAYMEHRMRSIDLHYLLLCPLVFSSKDPLLRQIAEDWWEVLGELPDYPDFDSEMRKAFEEFMIALKKQTDEQETEGV